MPFLGCQTGGSLVFIELWIYLQAEDHYLFGIPANIGWVEVG